MTSAQKELNFTFEQAFAIQTQQRNEWAKVLNKRALAALDRKITAMNQLGYNDNPFNVFRGQCITEFISNLTHNNTIIKD